VQFNNRKKLYIGAKAVALLGSEVGMYFLHFIIAALLGSGYSFDQSTPDTVRKPSPTFYSSGPVTEYNRAQPISRDALRFKRGERYNVSEPGVSELGESSEPILLDLAPTHFSRDPLPFNRSDTVVTGTVTAGQAYLTNDKRAIYSELGVTLNDRIKAEQFVFGTRRRNFHRAQGRENPA
jgi:hypothetical protein